MNQEQTNITTGKQIRHLRTQLGMTQEELAGELNVTRQALSNWERDVNEPDLNMLKKICFLFGVNMDDFAKEVITKMETYEKIVGLAVGNGGFYVKTSHPKPHYRPLSEIVP